MRPIKIDPFAVHLSHGANFSRSGRPHDLQSIEGLAALLLAEGQRTPIEVYPLAWGPDEPHEATLAAREAGLHRVVIRKRAPDAYGLISGYRRTSAARLLVERSEVSPAWDGKIAALVRTSLLSDQEIEDHNLSENVEREGLTPIDQAVVLQRLTAAPEDGGRGEEMELAARRLLLPGGVPRGHKLLKLLGLVDEARDLVRLNTRDPYLGITVDAGVSLARFSAEQQRQILADAADAAGQITPKSLRSILAPRQGRAGQPYAPSGQALTRLEHELTRMARDSGQLQRLEITEREALLLGKLLRSLRGEDGGLPPALDKIVQRGLARS